MNLVGKLGLECHLFGFIERLTYGAPRTSRSDRPYGRGGHAENNDIAEQLMLPVQVVSKWRKRYYHEGLDERPRPGWR